MDISDRRALSRSSSSPASLSSLSSSSSSSSSSPSSSSSSPSSSSDPEGRKACMILEGVGCFRVFIVNLDSGDLNSKANMKDDFIPLLPSLLIIRPPGSLAFCVLDLTLFMFECGLKLIFSSDLSPYSSPNSDSTNCSDIKKLELDDLIPAANIEHAKSFPYAIPTPDGKKILLYSSSITYADVYNYAHEDEQQVDFELYDPFANTWQKLPGLFLDSEDGPSGACFDFGISACAFVNDSTFFVETEHGMFALDLGKGDGWVRWDSFFGAPHVSIYVPLFFVVEGELCLTPSSAYDIKTRGKVWFDLPVPIPSRACLIARPDIRANGEYGFCTLRSDVTKERYPQLILTMYKCHLDRYREDKQKKGGKGTPTPPRIDMVESFKFVANARQLDIFMPIHLSIFN